MASIAWAQGSKKLEDKADLLAAAHEHNALVAQVRLDEGIQHLQLLRQLHNHPWCGGRMSAGTGNQEEKGKITTAQSCHSSEASAGWLFSQHHAHR